MQWRPADATAYSAIPPSLFSYKEGDVKKTAKPVDGPLLPTSPGDGDRLLAVHPAFDLAQARPENFHPKVGGMDFLPDGRLIICTWDSIGGVYILDHLKGNDPQGITVKRIAAGLAEPLGIKVVDNQIYVMQKQELTRLVDLNNDEIIDSYETICNGWKVSLIFMNLPSACCTGTDISMAHWLRQSGLVEQVCNRKYLTGVKYSRYQKQMVPFHLSLPA
ncbi:MAG: hypothetical protein WDN26_18895 [Chitinophagaceae bacterium]